MGLIVTEINIGLHPAMGRFWPFSALRDLDFRLI